MQSHIHNEITIASWIYVPSSVPSSEFGFLKYIFNYASSSAALIIYPDFLGGGKLRGTYNGLSSASGGGMLVQNQWFAESDVATVANIPRDRWVFVATTYNYANDVDDTKVYIDLDGDGQFQVTEIFATTNDTPTINDPTLKRPLVPSPVAFYRMYIGDNNFPGYIDELMVFDRELTQSELEVLAKG